MLTSVPHEDTLSAVNPVQTLAPELVPDGLQSEFDSEKNTKAPMMVPRVFQDIEVTLSLYTMVEEAHVDGKPLKQAELTR